MVDKLSPGQRSALMAKVGSRNTKPEMMIRRMLHARGWRYRLHQRGLPGTPDIVFAGRKVVIFVHGCFWHGHDCSLGRLPKTRTEFWAEKLVANRNRDARKVAELRLNGWRVFTVWQCSLKDASDTLSDIESFLHGDVFEAETANMPRGT